MAGVDLDSGNGKEARVCVQVVHLSFPVKSDNKAHLMLRAFTDTVHYLEALISLPGPQMFILPNHCIQYSKDSSQVKDMEVRF